VEAPLFVDRLQELRAVEPFEALRRMESLLHQPQKEIPRALESMGHAAM
jgi:hypothetical protein